VAVLQTICKPDRKVAKNYVFADEAGNFDFSTGPSASKYFILGTMRLAEPETSHALLDLRRDLAFESLDVEYFHASVDKQIVRNAVFDVLSTLDFRADFTIFEKRKVVPHNQSEQKLYKLAWFQHFKWVGPRIVKRSDELLVTAASIGTKKRRRAFRIAIDDVVCQCVNCASYEVAFWPAASDPCL
jgi:hypothetical protein